MARKGFSPIIAILFLALLLAGGGAWFMLTRQEEPTSPAPPAAPPPASVPKPPSPATPPPSPAPTPEPSPPTATPCRITGCSSQVCAEKDIITTCEFRPEYACYKTARCERQTDGRCGWTPTPELTVCLERARTAPLAPPTPAPQPVPPPPAPPPAPAPPPTPEPMSFRIEADDRGFYPSGTIAVAKGTKVKLTFAVRTTNVYYGGLDFRSQKFQTVSVKPGDSASVEFTADESFDFSSYWPLSGVLKATGRVFIE